MTAIKLPLRYVAAASAIMIALNVSEPTMARQKAGLSGSPEVIAATLDDILLVERREHDEPMFFLRNRGSISLDLQLASSSLSFTNERSAITIESGGVVPLQLFDGYSESSIAVPVRVLNTRVHGRAPIAYVIQCGPWDGVRPC